LASIPASATSNTPIAVHGDSTAIGSRISGIARFFNLFPGLDSQRWWNRLAKSYVPPRAVFNDGVGGQTITAMRDKMERDARHRRDLTIIYDRRNPGETADFYMASLNTALATLQTDRFLVLPQVRWATMKDEDLPVVQEINRRLLAKWPHNTFNGSEAAAFAKALSDPSTRIDGFHRNAKGQEIEYLTSKRGSIPVAGKCWCGWHNIGNNIRKGDSWQLQSSLRQTKPARHSTGRSRPSPNTSLRPELQALIPCPGPRHRKRGGLFANDIVVALPLCVAFTSPSIHA